MDSYLYLLYLLLYLYEDVGVLIKLISHPSMMKGTARYPRETHPLGPQNKQLLLHYIIFIIFA